MGLAVGFTAGTSASSTAGLGGSAGGAFAFFAALPAPADHTHSPQPVVHACAHDDTHPHGGSAVQHNSVLQDKQGVFYACRVGMPSAEQAVSPAAAGAGACAAGAGVPFPPALGGGAGAPDLAPPFAGFAALGAPAGASAFSAFCLSFLAALPTAGAPASLAPLAPPLIAGAETGAPAALLGGPATTRGTGPLAAPPAACPGAGAGARAPLTTTLPKGTPFLDTAAGAGAVTP